MIVRIFITLEKASCASEVMARMFITLDGPSRAGEGIAVLINYSTPMSSVHGISYPIGIPPKPLEVVVSFSISAHGDHF